MAQINVNLGCEIQEPVKVRYLEGNLFSQDNQANVINVTVTDGGEPATISGTVTADIIRPDGGTVAATGGTISGNVVSIALPGAAYAVPGVVSIVVRLTDSGTVTTIAAVVATVYRASTDAAIDPGTIIPSIDELIAQIEAAIASIPADYSSLWTSLAPAFSANGSYEVGQFVTYNGAFYRFKIKHSGSWNSSHVTLTNVGDSIFGNFYALSVANCVDVPSNSDFNDYVTPGNYAVKTVAIAKTISNIPVQLSGRLTVEQNYSTSLVMQTYVDNTREKIHVRKINTNTTPYTVGEWRQIAFNDTVGVQIADVVKKYYALNSTDLVDIPEGSDANEYLTPGNYAVRTFAIAQTVDNLPVKRGGRLTVEHNNSTSLLMQTYIDTTRENIYIRKINTSTEPYTYGEWRGIAFEDSVLSQRHIKILCIGNSGTNDCTAYTPYIVGNIADARFTIGTSYYGGASIDSNLGYFDNDDAVLTYYKKTPDNEAWTTTRNKTMKEIIADEDWDIITFQQASTYRGTLSSYANLNEFINKVSAYLYAQRGKTAKIGWLSPQFNLDKAQTVPYASIVECEQSIFETTPIEFIVQCMVAVENARTTSLNNLGDGGGMTYDGAHLQCGLPSLVPSYLAAMKFLDIAEEPRRGILYEHTRPVQEWIDEHHTPGENGTSTGVTDANCLLAQQCAIAAIKFPDTITDCSNYE